MNVDDAGDEESHYHHVCERRYWKCSIRLGVFTTVGALAAAGGALYGANESRKGADAAIRQAAAAEKQLQSDRPFIFAEADMPNAQQWRHGEQPLEWHFRFTNYGRTPAVILKVQAAGSITDARPPFPAWGSVESRRVEDKLISAPHVRLDDHKYDIPAGTVISAGSKGRDYTAYGDQTPLLMENAPPDVLAKRGRLNLATAATGPVHFWLVGNVFYEDASGTPYSTNFCLRVSDYFSAVIQDGDADCNERK